MKRMVLVAGLIAFGAVAAWAQSDVIEQRKNLMKQNADATKAPAGMLRGQVPFDLGQVQTALKTVSQNAKRTPTLFPESSKDGDTKALPAVWQNKAEFDRIAAQLGKDAEAALGSIKDEASFKSIFPKVAENCGTCHKTFRKS